MKRPILCLFVFKVLCLVGNCSGGCEDDLLDRARTAAVRGESKKAVQLATQAIAGDSELAAAYYLRGREHFRLGRVTASVADFDRFVELRPSAKSRQWERGISLYYAGQYEQGAQQFELYQTFHDSDVENSVWRYLCMVPRVGVARARAAMLPIRNDPRAGMMQVYELFRGQSDPDEVLAAFRQGMPNPRELAGRMFYAHLYLALYYESLGDKVQAERYIGWAADPKLADNPNLNSYMWDVARIHKLRLHDKQKNGRPSDSKESK